MFLASKQGKLQKRGKINLIGRLQLTTEKTREEDNEGIIQLRILRTQVSHNIHTYIRTYIHTHIHTYIYTYMHTYIHTYIHTYL